MTYWSGKLDIEQSWIPATRAAKREITRIEKSPLHERFDILVYYDDKKGLGCRTMRYKFKAWIRDNGARLAK